MERFNGGNAGQEKGWVEARQMEIASWLAAHESDESSKTNAERDRLLREMMDLEGKL